MRRALVTCGGSIAFHAAFVALAVLVTALKREPLPVPMPAPADPIDVWSGVTSALGGERLVDVNVDALGGQPAPAGQAVQGSPPAAPPPPPIAAAAPAPALEKPTPAPAVEKPTPADEPAEPRPKPRPKKPKPAAVDPAASSSAVDPDAEGKPARPAPPASKRAVKRRAGGEASGESGDGAKLGPFGAEGPSAVRSLGRAFTRAIPLANQADPGWGTLPAGHVGAIEIAITIDETGHTTGYKPLTSAPPKQLLALVKRTMDQLDAGTFALKGNLSAGVEVLRIEASVSDVEATEVGGAVALSSSGEGQAAFTQSSGRHVEVTLRVIKVDVPTSEP